MIDPELLKAPYLMNEKQRDIVSHKQGPLLVIAGPGSGKTRSLTLLAMNLLLCKDAEPSQLVLCTYTEKAAYELEDRLTSIAQNVGYHGDLSRLKIGTIHGICQQLVNEYLHRTSLGNNYETLDQFTQQLLIFEHLNEICPSSTKTFFRDRWGTAWNIAKKLKFYFDTIAEELVFDKLKSAFPTLRAYPTKKDTFLCYLTHTYHHYQHILVRTNSIDFAHLQKCAYNLLTQPDTFQKITHDIRYVLVDEYQDTNYIQERILTLLASGCEPKNLFVIGDEDQALYRFRGATVRNILTFTHTFPDCKQIYLITNYRSHPGIIDTCNKWMRSFDWSNPGGNPLRTEKTIHAVSDRHYPAYPSIISVEDVDIHAEAEQFSQLVYSLKQQGHISDYNEVALLLYSVRSYMSDAYIHALKNKGIPVYCSRARAFFDQQEISLLLACFMDILHYPEGQQHLTIRESLFPNYLHDCRMQLAEHSRLYPALAKELQTIAKEIPLTEQEHSSVNASQLADYFYRLIFLEPFFSFVTCESKKSNLVLFSKLLQTFQKHYRHSSITLDKLEEIHTDFFDRFFFFLFEDGVNQDEEQTFLKGHVQIMTIYQAKGLEFPVVFVGRMDKPHSSSADEHVDLQHFFYHLPFEPTHRIPGCDRKRLYYVAFSRAKDLLVLTANKQPHGCFASLWRDVPSWSSSHKSLLKMPKPVVAREYLPPKPRYGFTTHIQTYMTCPRRYQFFHEHRFAPSHSVEAFFGQLVHQTIEQIHRRVLDGQLDALDEQQIRILFEKVFTFLLCTTMNPVTSMKKEQAFHQVLTYFQQNRQEMQSIQETEFGIRVEQETYIVTGKIDLLKSGQNGLEILDFKTLHRPEKDSPRLTSYKEQLYLYAYAFHKRTGRSPQHLLFYWTAEEQKEDAIMEVPFQEEDMKLVLNSVDDIVAKIQQRQFDVVVPPGPETCKACDVRRLCKKERLI